MPTSLNSGSMPKVRASSGMIGTIRGPSSLSRMRLRRIRVKTIVVDTAVWLPAANSASIGGRRARAGGCARTTRFGIGPAERLATLRAGTATSSRVRARVVVRRVLELGVRDRQLEPIAEDAQLVLGQLLGLVRDVAGLDARAQGPALDRLGQDDRRARPCTRSRPCRRRRPCGSRGRRGGAWPGRRRTGARRACAGAGPGRRSARGCTPPPATLNFWNSPSSVSFICWTSTPSTSRARSSSHSRAQMTLMTFQPEPRKTASSSWMILPLPRTGPSRRCRLQLTTKVRLSRPSRAATCERAERLRLVGLAVAEEGPHARRRWCRAGRGSAGSD